MFQNVLNSLTKNALILTMGVGGKGGGRGGEN